MSINTNSSAAGSIRSSIQSQDYSEENSELEYTSFIEEEAEEEKCENLESFSIGVQADLCNCSKKGVQQAPNEEDLGLSFQILRSQVKKFKEISMLLSDLRKPRSIAKDIDQ